MTEQETKITKLQMIDIDGDILGKSLLVEGDDHKRIAVERLGIEIQEGEKPINAWLRHLAEINGLPVMTPCHPRIKDAIYASMETMKFMFFIS